MRRYCEKCHKSVYDTKKEAQEEMEKFKNVAKMKFNGKRIKHRAKKPEQKRAYYCEESKGFHITKMTHWEGNKSKDYERTDN